MLSIIDTVFEKRDFSTAETAANRIAGGLKSFPGVSKTVVVSNLLKKAVATDNPKRSAAYEKGANNIMKRTGRLR